MRKKLSLLQAKLFVMFYFVMISGPMKYVGRNVERMGTYVTRIKNTNNTAKKGSAARTTKNQSA